jgi:RHS repeat-associated protein
MTTGGRTYFYLTDAIGSVVALADADGNKVNSYAYSPRGVRLVAQSYEPVAQPYRFACGYQDPTGLYHFQARYYDANIGRFTQPDPSGQEKNPYLYAEGDPYEDAFGTALSFAVDKGVTAGCLYLTVGVGSGGCALAGMAAGEVTGAVYDRAK